ncbi:MAG: hypothetical protein RL701_2220, partial [Pseudomonadota bacterium]
CAARVLRLLASDGRSVTPHSTTGRCVDSPTGIEVGSELPTWPCARVVDANANANAAVNHSQLTANRENKDVSKRTRRAVCQSRTRDRRALVRQCGASPTYASSAIGPRKCLFHAFSPQVTKQPSRSKTHISLNYSRSRSRKRARPGPRRQQLHHRPPNSAPQAEAARAVRAAQSPPRNPRT